MSRVNHNRTWISALEAAHTLGLGVHALKKLGTDGVIGTMAVPGNPVRYNARDVADLARLSERPANRRREFVET